MKLAQKMMLVPAGRPDPEISSLSNLDQAMSNVLNNKNLTNIDKINLYQMILRKNLAVEARLRQKSVNIPNKPDETILDTTVATTSEPSELEENIMDICGLNQIDVAGLLDHDKKTKKSLKKAVKRSYKKNVQISPIRDWSKLLRHNINKNSGRKLSYAHKYDDSFIVEKKQYKRKVK